MRVICLPGILLTIAVCSISMADDAPTRFKPVDAPESSLDQNVFDALTKRIEATSDGSILGALYDDRASEYGRAGKWGEAASDFDRARAADPDHSHYWMRGGVCRLLAHDPMGYQGLIESMIEQFKETKSIYDMERVAKMCVLSKRTVGKQAYVEDLIDRAVVGSAGTSWGEYFPSSQAIVRYRYGKYEEALESVTASNEINDREESGDVTAINAVVAALCHAKLGSADEARAELAKGEKMLREALAQRDIVRDSGYWHDWMIAKLLHDEAREVLEKAGISPAR